MAARFAHVSVPAEREPGALTAVSPGALLLALALPLLLLHRAYQPSVSVSLAGTSATGYLSDFAVAAVVLAAVAAWLRRRGDALRAGAPLWAAGAVFLAWVALEVAYGRAHSGAYDAAAHAVTAAKFAEYALLAPAVAVLVRRHGDLLAVLWSLALSCGAATVVALAQFFGADVALAVQAGRRQASFLGYADYSTLAVVAAVVGVAALTVPSLRLDRRLGLVALVSGGLGTILAG